MSDSWLFEYLEFAYESQSSDNRIVTINDTVSKITKSRNDSTLGSDNMSRNLCLQNCSYFISDSTLKPCSGPVFDQAYSEKFGLRIY